jgi:spore germination protein D
MQFDLLKSPEYRKEVMKIMTEALEQPTFRLLFMDSLKQAVKETAGGQKENMTGSKQQGKSSSGKEDSSQDNGGGGDDSSGSGSDSGGN